VQLVTLKRAEDGRGLILRLLETVGIDADVAITPVRLGRIGSAAETNLVEEDLRPLPVEAHAVHAHIRPWGTATVRLIPRENA
jgi:alpha-mannosidase